MSGAICPIEAKAAAAACTVEVAASAGTAAFAAASAVAAEAAALSAGAAACEAVAAVAEAAAEAETGAAPSLLSLVAGGVCGTGAGEATTTGPGAAALEATLLEPDEVFEAWSFDAVLAPPLEAALLLAPAFDAPFDRG